mmetsp:Transcript_26273/g.49910  ORF Transcript_26273/g.49910 Transcript_26273/m.49910 type:complete len:243 (-) Transcript_26273:1026-1754(-)
MLTNHLANRRVRVDVLAVIVDLVRWLEHTNELVHFVRVDTVLGTELRAQELQEQLDVFLLQGDLKVAGDAGEQTRVRLQGVLREQVLYLSVLIANVCYHLANVGRPHSGRPDAHRQIRAVGAFEHGQPFLAPLVMLLLLCDRLHRSGHVAGEKVEPAGVVLSLAEHIQSRVLFHWVVGVFHRQLVVQFLLEHLLENAQTELSLYKRLQVLDGANRDVIFVQQLLPVGSHPVAIAVWNHQLLP